MVSSGRIRDILESELSENWEWGTKEWNVGYKPRPVIWSSSSGTKLVHHWWAAWCTGAFDIAHHVHDSKGKDYFCSIKEGVWSTT